METSSQNTMYDLLEQYLTASINEAEKARLAAWLQQPQGNEILQQFIDERLNEKSLSGETKMGLMEESFQSLASLINQPIVEEHIVAPAHRVHFLLRWWAAAAILIIAGTAIYFWTTSKKTTSLAENIAASPTDVLPGSNKALLTLSDGTTIVLDSAANGTLAQQGNASVTKLADGEVVYNIKGSPNGEALMNTLQTPIGGQYRLTLPDGTKVWLNAASSIAYPAAFTGHDRKIKISGEVYLEVAKNKAKPFIVDVDGKSSIEVLGTGFNINAYANENIIKTTLVEGSIKLNASLILKPGQQAQINPAVANLQPKLITVNTEQVIAWKNGYFNFENVSLREMGRQIERWYNIKTNIEGELNNVSLKGEMDRGVKLSDIMRFFNDCGFETILNNGILTVKQK